MYLAAVHKKPSTGGWGVARSTGRGREVGSAGFSFCSEECVSIKVLFLQFLAPSYILKTDY